MVKENKDLEKIIDQKSKMYGGILGTDYGVYISIAALLVGLIYMIASIL